MSATTCIKVCGVTCVRDAEACVQAGVTCIGLNLIAASPRYIEPAAALALARAVGRAIEIVIVLANSSIVEIQALLEETGASLAQLHGDEPPETLLALLPRAYKAIRVASADDIALADTYPGDRLLVDAKVAGRLGGTGQVVDFDLVAPLARRRRVILAGGLSPDNAARAVERVRPFGVDVASGVEVPGQPRRKDWARIAAFVQAVRSVGQPEA